MAAGLTIEDVAVKISADVTRLEAGIQAAQVRIGELEKKVERTGQAFNSFGYHAARSLQEVGRGLLYVGGAMTGVEGAAIKWAGEFDQAMTESVAIMENLSDVMKNKMERAARDVALTTIFSAKESADALYYLASSGYRAEHAISALPVVARFAQAGLMNMAQATEYLLDAHKALDMYDPSNYEHNARTLAELSDVITKAAIESNATVEQFAESLSNKAAARMRMANVDFREGTAVLAAYAEQGIKGVRAGERFDIFIRELTKSANKNADAFKKAGIAVYDAHGMMRPMADIVEDLENHLDGLNAKQKAASMLTLGFTAKSQFATLALVGMSDRIRFFEEQLRNAGGATEEVANKQMETFTRQLGLAWKAIKDVGIELGNHMIPVLTQLLRDSKPLVEMLATLVEWFGKLPPSMRLTLMAIGPFTLALGGFTMMLGKAAYALVLMDSAMKASAGATGAAQLAGSLSKVGMWLGKAGLAGAVGVLSYSMTRWLIDATIGTDKFDAKLASVWNKLRGINETLLEQARGNGPGAGLSGVAFTQAIAEANAKAALMRRVQTTKGKFDPNNPSSWRVTVGDAARSDVGAPPPPDEDFDLDEFITHQRAVQKMMDDLSGASATAELSMLEEALVGMNKRWDELPLPKVEGLVKQIQQLKDDGGQASDRLETIHLGLQHIAGIGNRVEKIPGLPDFIPADAFHGDLGMASGIDALAGYDPLDNFDFLVDLAKSGKDADMSMRDVRTTLENMGVQGSKLESVMRAAFGSAAEKTTNWGKQLSMVSDIMRILGVSSDSMFGRVIGGMTVALAAGQQFKDALDANAGKGDKVGMAMAIGSGIAASYSSGSILGGAASGAMTGATIGSVVPGIGTAIGAGVGAVAGGIAGFFGGGKKEKEAEEQRKQAFAQLRDQLVQTYGGLNNLYDAATRYGVAMHEAMASGDVDSLQGAVDSLTKKIEGLKTAVAGVNTVIANLTYKDDEGNVLNTFSDPKTAEYASALFSTTFWQLYEKEGLSAIEQMKPAWDQLHQHLVDLGLDPNAMWLGDIGRLMDVSKDPKTKALLQLSQGSAQLLGGAVDAGYMNPTLLDQAGGLTQASLKELVAQGLSDQEAAQALRGELAAQAKAYQAMNQELPEWLTKAMEDAGMEMLEDQLDVLKDIRSLLGYQGAGAQNASGYGYDQEYDYHGHAIPAASGFGPVVVGNMGGGLGPLIQTHAGEGVMVIPKSKVKNGFFVTAARGLYNREGGEYIPSEYEPTSEPVSPEESTSLTTTTAQQSAILAEVVAAVRQVAGKPAQDINVTQAPQIHINEDPLSTRERREDMRRFNLDAVERAIKMGEGTLRDTIREAVRNA